MMAVTKYHIADTSIGLRRDSGVSPVERSVEPPGAFGDDKYDNSNAYGTAD